MKKKMMKKKKIEEEEELTGGRGGYDIPEEIISQILSRLPAKTLTQFKTTCKQWLSLISHPSFARLRLTSNATTSGLFVYARNILARQQYILTGRPEGGPLVDLLIINNVNYTRMCNTRTEHLNGLVLFTCDVFAYVINPTTRQVFKLPFPRRAAAARKNVVTRIIHKYNFFGFDQSQNQHKILHMRVVSRHLPNPGEHVMTEFEVFSMSDYSWRKLDNPTTIPDVVFVDDVFDKIHSVCVNSVIHVMIPLKRMIWTFDLITECFSVINIPVDLPRKSYVHQYHIRQRTTKYKCNAIPFLAQINGGLLGLVGCLDRLAVTNQIHIWILQDYENGGVWVRKTITLSTDKSWIELGAPLPLDFCNDKEFVFLLGNSRLPKEKNAISVPIYDLKNESFKSLNFFIGDHSVSCSEYVEFRQYKSYVENLSPLINNAKLAPIIDRADSSDSSG